jgi:acetylornithine deacetylase/succinyl-diaminopimelate desuccinylase-like protein
MVCLLFTIALGAVEKIAARDRQAPATSLPAEPTVLTVHGDPLDPTDVPAELKKIYAHIDAEFDRHVARLQSWVRIPSISNTVEGRPAIWESARFIRDVIVNELGCTAEVHDPGLTDWGAPGHPVVYGRCDVGAEKTLLLYAMGDAMPIYGREHAWTHEPFGAQLSERPPFKLVMNGRAANNNKGKDLGTINALLSIKAVTGTLPVNVIFVIEHDEERMDLGLRKFMFDHPELFKDADAAFVHGGNGQTADGRGQISGQSIGCVVFDLETSSGAPGLWLDSQPLWRHMKMITTLFDEGSPLIKGLERDAQPMSAEELAYYKREVAAAPQGRSLEDLIRLRMGVRVTVTGTWSGNMAPGYAGNYRPPVATSKIDIRYPPGVDGEEIVRRVRAELDRSGYADVRMNVVGDVPWSWANADTEIAAAALKMFRQFGVAYTEHPKGNFMPPGGTYYGPNYLFARGPLKLPVVVAGLGWGAGSHADNEYYVMKGDGKRIYGFAGAMKAFATLLYNWAAPATPLPTLGDPR